MEDTCKESESSDFRKSDLDEKQDESSQDEMKDAQEADEADKGTTEENKPQSSESEDDEDEPIVLAYTPIFWLSNFVLFRLNLLTQLHKRRAIGSGG